jgi:hypothetical protein
MSNVSKNQRTNRGAQEQPFEVLRDGVVVFLPNGKAKYAGTGPNGLFAGMPRANAEFHLMPGEVIRPVDEVNAELELAVAS